MAFFIPEGATYDSGLDKEVNRLIFNIYDIIAICKKMRQPIHSSLWGINWYIWNNELRRISDALSLMEHDAFLLAKETSELSRKLWGLYYKENPDTTEDKPELSMAEVAEMRANYF